MIKNKNNIKVAIITLASTLIMATSSIVIYANVSQPKFYDQFMDIGNKYLEEGKYEEAILSFDKLIKIDEKSTEARIGLAKGYVGIHDNDKAIESVKEAQSLDMENSKLLLEILEILKDVDLDTAYEILQNYINQVGKDNISSEIKDIVNLSNESPKQPIANPEPGTYINPISIKLQLDKMRLGHSFYYTTDGSQPSKNSNKYKNSISIDKNTVIKLIGYNQKGESTEVFTLEYIIDTEIVRELDNLIKECKTLMDSTQVGTKVGNCVEGSKEELSKVINKVNNELKDSAVGYDAAKGIESELNEALKIFKSKIIEETNKSKLKNIIDQAIKIHDEAVEGIKEGQYKVGSKNELKNAINKVKIIYGDALSKQSDVDNSISSLEKSIIEFKNNKIIVFTKEKVMKYMENTFGRQFTSSPESWNLEQGYGGLNYGFREDNMYIDSGKRYYKVWLEAYFYGNPPQQEKVHKFICNGGEHLDSCLPIAEINVYEDGKIIVESLTYDI